MERLYHTKGLSIFHDAANDWLYVEWKGNHTAETARTGGELVLQHLSTLPCCMKMLNDNSQVTSEWQRGAKWVGGHYYQTLAERGIRYVAWICPPNWGARKSMEAAMQFVTKPMVILFDDLASGHSWLSRQAVPAMSGRV